jgi:hypothetical protein
MKFGTAGTRDAGRGTRDAGRGTGDGGRGTGDGTSKVIFFNTSIQESPLTRKLRAFVFNK